MSNRPPSAYVRAMIDRSEIIWLGVGAGVGGGLVGGLMLGIGMAMALSGIYLGWLLMLPGVPIAALPGWLLARKLAARLPAER